VKSENLISPIFVKRAAAVLAGKYKNTKFFPEKTSL